MFDRTGLATIVPEDYPNPSNCDRIQKPGGSRKGQVIMLRLGSTDGSDADFIGCFMSFKKTKHVDSFGAFFGSMRLREWDVSLQPVSIEFSSRFNPFYPFASEFICIFTSLHAITHPCA